MLDNEKNESSTELINDSSDNFSNNDIIPQESQLDNTETLLTAKELDKVKKKLIDYDNKTNELVKGIRVDRQGFLDKQELDELYLLDKNFSERRVDVVGLELESLKSSYNLSKKSIKKRYQILKKNLNDDIKRFKEERNIERREIQKELKSLEKKLDRLTDEQKVEKAKEKSINDKARLMKWESRFFSFVIYPESAPDGWRRLLEFSGIPFAISPLHDSDKEADGKLKKAHYHIMGVYPDVVKGGIIYKHMVQLLGENCVNTVVETKDFDGSHKYLTHSTAKAMEAGKFRYNESDITYFNGFKVDYDRHRYDFDLGGIHVFVTDIIKRHRLTSINALFDYYYKNRKKFDDYNISYDDLVRLSKNYAYMWSSMMSKNYNDKLENLKNENKFLKRELLKSGKILEYRSTFFDHLMSLGTRKRH